MKEKCTRNKEGRRITRWVDEHIIEETQQRVEAHPEIMQQRKELVEHPLGTIKHWWDQGHFLVFFFFALPLSIWVKLRPNLSFRRLSF